ncbi:MAG: SDR family oxidoreductase [Saprospiraceae bacterium]|nr:SDR family oxidoreductase [Saprospiraceae bacterium]
MVAIVTGAASGIGKHFAGELATRGFQLVLADVNEEGLAAAFTPHHNTLLFHLDVRRADQWTELIAAALQRFGRIDYLFNIAGIIQPGFIAETAVEWIDRHIDINAKGVMYGTKLVSEVMVKQRSGHIVNIASLAGVAPIKGISFYSASKYAVRGFSLAAAYELRPHGVFVTVVCPDLVDTPMLDLQLNYPREAALTFSGPKRALQVSDISRVLWRVMKDKPLEVMFPASRGWMARLGNLLPALAQLLDAQLTRKGLRRAKWLSGEGERGRGGEGEIF